ncbi:hypothetical protein [Paracoccus benzoatiresistens]|uniref:Uncharacterized protein n=1 Tax=Paracoccus benzoatiresistens TaxID=2997341 RepID=A0ABT4J9V7_9RHOB|nr:hypothetical protein [Paracoccus sp. EF6]MCZ0963865.1 hypothetical protein [Paracoccus sp. EF6]
MGTLRPADNQSIQPRDPQRDDGDPGRLQDREDADTWQKPDDEGVAEQKSRLPE